MASSVVLPTRADLLKLQAKHAVAGKEVSPLGSTLQKIEALGKDAYARISDEDERGLYGICKLGQSLEREIEKFTANNKQKHPKFCLSLSVEFTKPLESLFGTRKNVRHNGADMTTKITSVKQQLLNGQALLPPSDATNWDDVDDALSETYSLLEQLASLSAKTAAQLGTGPFQALASEFIKMGSVARDLRKHAKTQAGGTRFKDNVSMNRKFMQGYIALEKKIHDIDKKSSKFYSGA